MKKISMILAALAAAFAVSCNKETVTPQTPDTSAPAGMKMITITASVDDVDTKTSYDAGGKFSWTKGDQISVLASDNNFYTFTATSSGAYTELMGEIPTDASIGRFAFFPASDNHTYDSATWYSYFSIDEYKDLKDRVSAEIPMYGLKGDNDSFAFKHLTGAAKLTFTNIPAGVTNVEISIKNEQCKFSGVWKVSTSSWSWSSALTEVESELTYTRKVPVSDNNTAILYLPYRGGIWYSSTINIIGFKGDEELHLLKNKKMRGNSTEFGVAKVIPYATLPLPDYVPEADLTKVDWSADGVQVYDLPSKASSSRQALRQVKVVADKHYVYARLVASAEYLKATSSDYFGLFIYDAIDGTGDGYYGWNNNAAGNNEYNGEHAGTLNITDYSVALTVDKTSVDVTTQVSGDEIVWMMAIPRSAHANLASAGSAYFTFLTYAGWTPSGSVPEKYDPMLEVTLP